jgi:hypothetical protein
LSVIPLVRIIVPAIGIPLTNGNLTDEFATAAVIIQERSKMPALKVFSGTRLSPRRLLPTSQFLSIGLPEMHLWIANVLKCVAVVPGGLRLKWIHEQRDPFAKLLTPLVFFLLSPIVGVAAAQGADAKPTCPGLKFEIRVPDDIIRPQSSVLLELKLTNVTQEEMWLPSGSPDFWSYEFELKDAQGSPVQRTLEWMRATSERPTNVTLNASVPLAAGASLTKTVILDKLFDLSKQGPYTGRASFDSFACNNSGTRVTSNLINFTVGKPSRKPSGSKLGISVTANASRAHLPMGWAVPLDIVVQNTSTHPLRWAVDNPPNTAPDEFLTGTEVFDAAGETRSPPKLPDPNWSFSRFRGVVSILEIPPGKSAEQIVLIGDLFDVSQPGKYRAKV